MQPVSKAFWGLRLIGDAANLAPWEDVVNDTILLGFDDAIEGMFPSDVLDLSTLLATVVGLSLTRVEQYSCCCCAC